MNARSGLLALEVLREVNSTSRVYPELVVLSAETMLPQPQKRNAIQTVEVGLFSTRDWSKHLLDSEISTFYFSTASITTTAKTKDRGGANATSYDLKIM
ncbi:Carboxymethylenebutenolidase [Fusarium oxysporum f. sp. albedinis]|nr:Carboxymethylenebutenolidase [Fusarium oxysporum f. sp. albedinis]